MTANPTFKHKALTRNPREKSSVSKPVYLNSFSWHKPKLMQQLHLQTLKLFLNMYDNQSEKKNEALQLHYRK